MAGTRLYNVGSVSLTVGQHCFNIPCLLGYHCPHGSVGLHVDISILAGVESNVGSF